MGDFEADSIQPDFMSDSLFLSILILTDAPLVSVPGTVSRSPLFLIF